MGIAEIVIIHFLLFPFERWRDSVDTWSVTAIERMSHRHYGVPFRLSVVGLSSTLFVQPATPLINRVPLLFAYRVGLFDDRLAVCRNRVRGTRGSRR